MSSCSLRRRLCARVSAARGPGSRKLGWFAARLRGEAGGCVRGRYVADRDPHQRGPKPGFGGLWWASVGFCGFWWVLSVLSGFYRALVGFSRLWWVWVGPYQARFRSRQNEQTKEEGRTIPAKTKLRSAPGTPHEGEEASEYETHPALLSHGGAPATLVAQVDHFFRTQGGGQPPHHPPARRLSSHQKRRTHVKNKPGKKSGASTATRRFRLFFSTIKRKRT